MRSERALQKTTKIFLALSALIYAAFIVCDILDVNELVSTILKFSGIVLCFLMTIFQCIKQDWNKDNICLMTALFFTMTADVFLLLLEKPLPGVILFIIVQMVYYYRYHLFHQYVTRVEDRVMSGHHLRKFILFILHIVIRLVLSAGVLLALYFFKIEINAVLCATVFYIISFAGNIILLFVLQTKKHYFQGNVRIGIFILGMVLFFLCDIQVGINNMKDYLTVSGALYNTLFHIAQVGMWACYLPGQVAIVMSGEAVEVD